MLPVCEWGDPIGCGLRAGSLLDFGGLLSGTVIEQDRTLPRLWKIRFSRSGAALIDALYRIGRPVRYEHVGAPWDIDYYQTVFAREPGSAEMPSAGRPFTWRLLFDLKRSGIGSAHVLLHTGLSSYLDADVDRLHPVLEEEIVLREDSATRINAARDRRILAIGTTVAKALEAASDEGGRVRALHDYTRLRITAEHRLRVVDGLLTGFHEPEASHLDLLTAFLPADVIGRAYAEAIRERYLWHEFGDVNLVL